MCPAQDQIHVEFAFFLCLVFRRNKHGCEMCRCVKCPPFTCDKYCPEGYEKNKKGCSMCKCKGTTTLTHLRICFINIWEQIIQSGMSTMHHIFALLFAFG